MTSSYLANDVENLIYVFYAKFNVICKKNNFNTRT